MMDEGRMFEVLTRIIDKLSKEVGMHNSDIQDMLEISEEEIKELNLDKKKLMSIFISIFTIKIFSIFIK